MVCPPQTAPAPDFSAFLLMFLCNCPPLAARKQACPDPNCPLANSFSALTCTSPHTRNNFVEVYVARLATRPVFVPFTYIYVSCQFGCRVYRVHRLLRSIGPTKERDRIGPALIARLVAHNLFWGPRRRPPHPRRRPPHASQGDIWAQGEPTRCGASLSTSTPSLSASERGRAAEHAKASVDDGCRSNKRLRRNML